ncbi:MAG: ABC transporter permease [Bacteroidaceae bacterium]|nr:ABC transporter permease [Bacteroidaceae bacterium]
MMKTWFHFPPSTLRELRRITSRRIYLVAAVVLPLFLIFFMATIFGSGQMVRLPIGIVDGDNTSSSRAVIRNIAATPTFDVRHRYADEVAARRALQRKQIYGYLSIPPRFEANLLRGHGVTLCYYYHYALLAVGGEVMSGFEQALLPVRMAPIVVDAVDLGATQTSVETFLLPMTSDDHALYNPSLNYATYLTVPIFYIMFQILVLLVTLYAVGSERKEGTASAWLAAARGKVWVAACSKLMPYTLLFVAEALLAGVVFFRFMAIPLQGNAWLLALAAVLFVLATQALALILYSLFPVLSFVISIVSMVGSLGATLSGVTFPLMAMYPIVRYVALLFPVRHFTVIMQQVVYSGGVGSTGVVALGVLLLFPLLAVALLPRLRHILTVRPYDTLE